MESKDQAGNHMFPFELGRHVLLTPAICCGILFS